MSAFALVRFTVDNVTDIVPVNFIKNFKPKSLTDYDPRKLYLVRWKESVSGCQQEADVTLGLTLGLSDQEIEYYKAQILMLDDSEENIRRRAQSSRIRFAKVLDTSVEDSSSDDELSLHVQKSKLAKEKKDKTKERSATNNSSLRSILMESMSTKKSYPLYPKVTPGPSSNNYSCDELQLKKTVSSQNQTITDLEEQVKKVQENLELKTQKLKKVQQLNLRLQTQLLSGLEKTSGTDSKKTVTPSCVQLAKDSLTSSQDITTCSSPQPSPSTSHSGKTPLEKDGKILLGGDVWLPTSKWEAISSQKKNSLFVKYLVTSVWGTDQLKERSINGRVCPRFNSEREAKKPLSPMKLKVVRDCFMKRLDDQEYSAKEKGYEEIQFRKYITEKLQDVARPPKKVQKTE